MEATGFTSRTRRRGRRMPWPSKGPSVAAPSGLFRQPKKAHLQFSPWLLKNGPLPLTFAGMQEKRPFDSTEITSGLLYKAEANWGFSCQVCENANSLVKLSFRDSMMLSADVSLKPVFAKRSFGPSMTQLMGIQKSHTFFKPESLRQCVKVRSWAAGSCSLGMHALQSILTLGNPPCFPQAPHKCCHVSRTR